MSALTFCPPAPAAAKASLTSTAPLTKNLGNHHPLVGSLPLTAANSSTPSPTTSAQQPLPATPAPSQIPQVKRKRVVKQAEDGQPPKRRRVPAHPPKAIRSPLLQAESSSSRSRSPTLRPTDSDSEPEIDYSTFGTRRSTPNVPHQKDAPGSFGLHEDWTIVREKRTEFLRQQLRCAEPQRDFSLAEEVWDSEGIVKPLMKHYHAYFRNPDDPNDTTFDPHPTDYPVVEVEYPAEDAKERYILLVPNDKDHYNPIMELLNAVYAIIKNYFLPHEQIPFGTLPPNPGQTEWMPDQLLLPESYPFPVPPPPPVDHLRNLEKAYNTHDGPLFIQSLQAINRLIRAGRDKMRINAVMGWNGTPPQVWKAVVEECYQRSIGPNIRKLSKYTPFSNEVYGELNASFVSDILFRTDIRANSVFVDLGCGVGNCLIQAALQCGCTSYGIEINENPADLGTAQVVQYYKRLQLWGLNAGQVDLVKGDMCNNPAVGEWIRKADVVLVNNWAFSPALNDALSLMFLDLREGARVVSMKPFRRPDFRLTDRTVSSVQAIFRVEEIGFRRGAVSWMAEGGVYYMHTVDRGPVRQFEEKMEQQILAQMQASSQRSAAKRRRKEAAAAAAATSTAAATPEAVPPPSGTPASSAVSDATLA
ncbi:Nucleosomal histone H3-Lys79 methylase [Tulasnella sp. UAMH 9824]|nr:Nucleosomal histone H3-Lys79 methylase [Tulasnella sp. UAMH 9824]